jgi:hypothetical protein
MTRLIESHLTRDTQEPARSGSADCAEPGSAGEHRRIRAL